MQDENPYQAPQAALQDPAVHELVLADRGMRLAGAIIDGMLLALILLPMMAIGGYFDGVMRGEQPSLASQLGWGLGGIVLFVIVQGVPLARSGQTWAKKMLKMRIVDLDGHQPPFGKLIGLRYLPTQLISMVPVLGALFGLVDALFIFGEERRCIHDLIAGTRVVRVD
jgi:uncharacterized RDD family membrane protein YckC